MIPNSSQVARIVSVVPERSARLQTGTPFSGSRSAGGGDTRLAYLAQMLNWLTPLNGMTKDDERELGLASGHGRLPRQDEDEEGDAGDGERGDSGASPFGASLRR